MLITWDEPKRLANLVTHGLDFADAARFSWNSSVVSKTYVSARGGRRFKATGLLDAKLISIIFAPLGTQAVAVISMRPASAKERRAYGKGTE